MAPTYQVEMTKKQAEGFKKFGLNPIEYKKDISALAKSDILKSDYIKLGIKNIESNFDENKGFNIAISPSESKKNWKDQNISLLEKGLYMSNPKEFMEFHNSVLDAYKNNKPLFDAAGNELKRDLVKQLYNNLISDEWANLNMNFEENNKGIWTIKEAKGLDKKKNLIYNEKKIVLPISEDSYVDPKSIDENGLPSRNSKSQKFKKGENIYFWSPVEGRVAWFGAGSGRAVLGCNGDSSDQNSILGAHAVQRHK